MGSGELEEKEKSEVSDFSRRWLRFYLSFLFLFVPLRSPATPLVRVG